MTRTLSICGVVAVLGGAMAVTALADVKKVGGSISINTAGTSAFAGKVKSKRRFCFRNRLVVLKRDTPGNGKDPIIGRDRTNRKGRYRVDLPNPVTGEFYARATRKIRIVSGNGVVCRPLETTVLHID
jgi:hypothetical protein